MKDSENTRLFGMLGFAMRAGKLVFGTDSVCKSMAKDARLILICADASEGTKKKLLYKSEFYGVKTAIISTESEKLGEVVGKTYAPVCVSVTDDNFAKEILKAIEGHK